MPACGYELGLSHCQCVCVCVFVFVLVLVLVCVVCVCVFVCVAESTPANVPLRVFKPLCDGLLEGLCAPAKK